MIQMKKKAKQNKTKLIYDVTEYSHESKKTYECEELDDIQYDNILRQDRVS